MDIRWHHIKYAAANSVWVLVAAAIELVILSFSRHLDLFGLVFGASVGAAMFVGFFLYFLWRTQRRLPPH